MIINANGNIEDSSYTVTCIILSVNVQNSGVTAIVENAIPEVRDADRRFLSHETDPLGKFITVDTGMTVYFGIYAIDSNGNFDRDAFMQGFKRLRESLRKDFGYIYRRVSVAFPMRLGCALDDRTWNYVYGQFDAFSGDRFFPSDVYLIERMHMQPQKSLSHRKELTARTQALAVKLQENSASVSYDYER